MSGPVELKLCLLKNYFYCKTKLNSYDKVFLSATKKRGLHAASLMTSGSK